MKSQRAIMTVRVLIADDHAVMRDGLRALLRTEGDIDVVGAAEDGREAVRLVCELAPNVVVMDIAMPGLNGIEATREIRRRSPSTAVIMLSMHSTSEHVYRAFEAGASGYLLKKRAGAEIAVAVRTISQGRHFTSPGLADPRADGDSHASPISRLTRRERQVLQLVVEGRSSAEIAGLIFLSPKSVETYRSRLMAKLGVADLPALVKFALHHGLTSYD
jgi:DNA-binding NarL/FixJ family response regulator